jgi:large subunit ribosomal protein L22
VEGGRKVSEAMVVKYTKSNRPRVLTKKEKKAQGIGKDEGKAILKYARISPSKVRIVINLIKGKNVKEAMAILKFTPKAASPILSKLLKSAVSNAENNNGMDVESLYVADAFANPGPTLKRIQPRAQGRAFKIAKRTSHITLVVKERK